MYAHLRPTGAPVSHRSTSPARKDTLYGTPSRDLHTSSYSSPAAIRAYASPVSPSSPVSPGGWTPRSVHSPLTPIQSSSSRYTITPAQREMVLQAARRHWDDPNGLPQVIRDVKATLLLPSVAATINLVEEVIGKPLPPDLIEECIDSEPRPPCVNGLMCPYVSERTHLDRYTHPCPRYYDIGQCGLVNNPTHTRFYSHGDQRPIGTASLGVLDPQALEPLSQSLTPRSLIPSPTPRFSTAHSPHDTRYSPRNKQATTTPAYATPRVRTPELQGGITTPSTPPTANISQQVDPSAAWLEYMSLMKKKETTILQKKYAKGAVVTVEQKGEGMIREYRGLPNISRFITWLANLMMTPSGTVVTSVDGDGTTARAVWKCPPSGFASVREVMSFAENGKIQKQKIFMEYRKPEKRVREPRSPRVLGPPEPFSNDPRLRGTPLTPKAEPKPRITTPPCYGANCSRASPTHYSRMTDEQRESVTPSRTTRSKVVVRKESREPEPELTPSEIEEQAEAAVRIQAKFRGMQTRKKIREEAPRRQEEDDDHKEQVHAATKIQAGFRGRKARKEVNEKKEQAEQEHAATMIQAGFRGRMARREAQEKKEQAEAATKIQANFRGRKARKEVEGLKDKGEEPRRLQPAPIGRKESQEKREQEHAATKIQASFRGQKARKELQEKKEQEHAATKIQASFRGQKARKELKDQGKI
eukprot:TRINITY_DN19238_c0_g1_i2.p1 TRINITY_DN19238_c0_g1~~TRINITY_DN19238_c0_g1_i2.p1  ORF type:complete len:701 (+),score=128.14 TRINITY_DN19238_c0_g1_i2:46-2148(+)